MWEDEDVQTTKSAVHHCPRCDQAVTLGPSFPAEDAVCQECRAPLWFLRKNLGGAVLMTFLPTTPANTEAVMKTRDLVAAAQQTPRVVLDMSRVPLVQSMLLGVLVATRRQLTDARAAVRLCGLSRQARDTFQATQLDKLFEICDDDRSALKSFDLAAKH